MDTEELVPECMELSANRILVGGNDPWFNETQPNQPITGWRIDAATGQKILSIFFNISPNKDRRRILYAVDVNFKKEFSCEEDSFIAFRSGFSEDYHSINKPYTQLTIAAPRDPARMIYG